MNVYVYIGTRSMYYTALDKPLLTVIVWHITNRCIANCEGESLENSYKFLTIKYNFFLSHMCRISGGRSTLHGDHQHGGRGQQDQAVRSPSFPRSRSQEDSEFIIVVDCEIKTFKTLQRRSGPRCVQSCLISWRKNVLITFRTYVNRI